MEEVKTSKNFYLTIVSLIKQGKPISHINDKGVEENSVCSILGLTKHSLNYYLSSLKKLNIVKKEGYGVWKVLREISGNDLEILVKKRSKNKSSLGTTITKPTTNLHALQIRFPILEGKIEDSDWEIKEKLMNWLPKYKKLDSLEGLTIKNNNNKSITVWAKSRNIKSLEEINNLAFKIRAYIYDYFKSKHNVILDVFNCETKNLDIATEDKDSESMLNKGEKFKLDLNKKAEKIFRKDNMDGKAWLDGSPFKFTAETNDLEWKREYLRMPFSVRDLRNAVFLMEEYNKNLKLHTQVQKEQLKTQIAIQRLLSVDKKSIKEKSRIVKPNQKTLLDF